MNHIDQYVNDQTVNAYTDLYWAFDVASVAYLIFLIGTIL
jgi:hypothetical protein